MTIDPVAMGLFNRLARLAKAQVVLCSARRFDRGIRPYLKRNGLVPKFHSDWRTGQHESGRGQEIQAWLDQHPEITTYLIFDDSNGMLPHQKPRHMQAELYNGLTWKNYEQARDLLGFKPGD